jgi:hypothetical protein
VDLDESQSLSCSSDEKVWYSIALKYHYMHNGI